MKNAGSPTNCKPTRSFVIEKIVKADKLEKKKFKLNALCKTLSIISLPSTEFVGNESDMVNRKITSKRATKPSGKVSVVKFNHAQPDLVIPLRYRKKLSKIDVNKRKELNSSVLDSSDILQNHEIVTKTKLMEQIHTFSQTNNNMHHKNQAASPRTKINKSLETIFLEQFPECETKCLVKTNLIDNSRVKLKEYCLSIYSTILENSMEKIAFCRDKQSHLHLKLKPFQPKNGTNSHSIEREIMRSDVDEKSASDVLELRPCGEKINNFDTGSLTQPLPNASKESGTVLNASSLGFDSTEHNSGRSTLSSSACLSKTNLLNNRDGSTYEEHKQFNLSSGTVNPQDAEAYFKSLLRIKDNSPLRSTVRTKSNDLLVQRLYQWANKKSRRIAIKQKLQKQARKTQEARLCTFVPKVTKRIKVKSDNLHSPQSGAVSSYLERQRLARKEKLRKAQYFAKVGMQWKNNVTKPIEPNFHSAKRYRQRLRKCKTAPSATKFLRAKVSKPVVRTRNKDENSVEDDFQFELTKHGLWCFKERCTKQILQNSLRWEDLETCLSSKIATARANIDKLQIPNKVIDRKTRKRITKEDNKSKRDILKGVNQRIKKLRKKNCPAEEQISDKCAKIKKSTKPIVFFGETLTPETLLKVAKIDHFSTNESPVTLKVKTENKSVQLSVLLGLSPKVSKTSENDMLKVRYVKKSTEQPMVLTETRSYGGSLPGLVSKFSSTNSKRSPKKDEISSLQKSRDVLKNAQTHAKFRRNLNRVYY